MSRRAVGSVVRRGGDFYARVTLHREPKAKGRSPRAEVLVTRSNGTVTEAWARTFARQTQALYDTGQWSPTTRPTSAAPEVTVDAWVSRWCSAQTYVTAKRDALRIARYLAGSALASTPVRSVTPRDVAAWLAHARGVRAARRAGLASERTVRNAYDVLRRALARAVFDGLLAQDPCAVLPPDVTPRAVDAQPERRRGYRMSREDVERLLGDDGIEDDRHVLYHALILTGARLAEAIGLRWCDVSPREPLAAVVIAEQVDARTGVRRATKTQAVREVPLHPVLGAVLAWWRASWPRWYGREAREVDLIVPARAHRAVPSVGSHRRQSAVWRDMQRDLVGAGIAEHRVHDLRHTFASLCADAGMAETVASRWTHAPIGRGARALYVLPSWQRQCAEMLRLEVRSGLAERVAGERAGECDAGGGA